MNIWENSWEDDIKVDLREMKLLRIVFSGGLWL